MSAWKLRNAGSRWRLLVHERVRGERMSVMAHDVRAGIPFGHERSEFETRNVLPNTEFDELVVGRWLHIEAMDSDLWWMDIGGVTVHVTADRDGRPKTGYRSWPW